MRYRRRMRDPPPRALQILRTQHPDKSFPLKRGLVFSLPALLSPPVLGSYRPGEPYHLPVLNRSLRVRPIGSGAAPVHRLALVQWSESRLGGPRSNVGRDNVSCRNWSCSTEGTIGRTRVRAEALEAEYGTCSDRVAEDARPESSGVRGEVRYPGGLCCLAAGFG